jgi:hypothetical protein
MGTGCASSSRGVSSRLTVDSEDDRLRLRFSSNSMLLAGLSESESHCRIAASSRVEGVIVALDDGELGGGEAFIVASSICSDTVWVVLCPFRNACVKCSYFPAAMSLLVLEVFEGGRMRLLLPHALSFVGEGNCLLN